MADNFLPHDVLAAFCHDPANCTATVLGSGNINDTYLIHSVSHAGVAPLLARVRSAQEDDRTMQSLCQPLQHDATAKHLRQN